MPGFGGIVARFKWQWVSNADRLDADHMGSFVRSLCDGITVTYQGRISLGRHFTWAFLILTN